jgi:hypothetical protein
VSKEDLSNFNVIKRQSKGKIVEKDVPSDAELEEIKINRILDEVKNSIKVDNLKNDMDFIKKSLSADITSEEIAAALLKKLREK